MPPGLAPSAAVAHSTAPAASTSHSPGTGPPPPPRPRSAAGPAPQVTVTVALTLAGDEALSAADEVTHGLWGLANDLSASAAVVNVATTISPVAAEAATGADAATAPGAEPEAAPDDAALLRLFPAARTATLDDAPVRLTRREYDLLLHLAQHPGRVFTRQQLSIAVWQEDFMHGERTVDVHVHRLRGKLGGRGPVITTVRGVGYRLDAAHRVRVVPG